MTLNRSDLTKAIEACNAEIESLNTELNSLRSTLASLNGQTSESAASQRSQISSAITAVSAQISSITSMITSMQAMIDSADYSEKACEQVLRDLMALNITSSIVTSSVDMALGRQSSGESSALWNGVADLYDELSENEFSNMMTEVTKEITEEFTGMCSLLEGDTTQNLFDTFNDPNATFADKQMAVEALIVDKYAHAFATGLDKKILTDLIWGELAKDSVGYGIGTSITYDTIKNIITASETVDSMIESGKATDEIIARTTGQFAAGTFKAGLTAVLSTAAKSMVSGVLSNAVNTAVTTGVSTTGQVILASIGSSQVATAVATTATGAAVVAIIGMELDVMTKLFADGMLGPNNDINGFADLFGKTCESAVVNQKTREINAQLRAELEAENERRIAQGLEPLDIDIEDPKTFLECLGDTFEMYGDAAVDGVEAWGDFWGGFGSWLYECWN